MDRLPSKTARLFAGRILVLWIMVIGVVVFLVAFPRKRPLRDLLPPLTFFDRFFLDHSFHVSRALQGSATGCTPLYDAFRRDPQAGGRRLDRLLAAAWSEDAFCGPLVQRYGSEIAATAGKDPAEADVVEPGLARRLLAAAGEIDYPGPASARISEASKAAWQAFPDDFKEMLCGLLQPALEAAQRGAAAREALGAGDALLPWARTLAPAGAARSKSGSQPEAAENPQGSDPPIPSEKEASRVIARLLPSLCSYAAAVDRTVRSAPDAARPVDLPFLAGDDWFPGGLLYAARTPYGVVLVGGEGDNLYPAGDALLIVDLGGNDTYFFEETLQRNASRGSASPGATVLDLGGDDRYQGGSGAGPAFGFFGCAAVMDCAGNDRYAAAGPSLGAGIFGLGALIDLAGDDQYAAGTLAMGAGVLGIGLLADGGGDDVYRAGDDSQGFAGPLGMGCLLDAWGNDLYLGAREQERPAVPDPESEDAFDWIAQPAARVQGACFVPPEWSAGGVGLLLDLAGDDTYRAGECAQGAASGMGLGLLLDRDGYDFFRGQDGCQGFGEQGGIGLLRDMAGNDRYLARDRAQGMGEDRSLGLLIDDAGDDRYHALGEAQGTRRANGTGMLCDGEGRDEIRSTHGISVTR